MAAQLRENREQVTTVDREAITRLIFLDNARDKFAAVHFGHQRSSFDLCRPSVRQTIDVRDCAA
jgi:hypothetical protein